MATVSDTTRSVTGLFRSLGATARNSGLLITAASGIAAAGLITLSQRANRVNAAFREVNTITRNVASTQERYGDLVSDLNTQFGLQINQIGVIDGLYQSLSAGITDTQEAQRSFLTTAADLAKVGLVDLETSVDVLSTVLNTYNMNAEEAGRVSTTLFQTVQLGKVRLEELAPVMGRVAALGSSMGIEFRELAGGMAQLTRTGFEARVAATGLRNVIRALIKPSDQMQETLLDIAAEQDFFADSLTSTQDKARSLASEYRGLTDSLDRYTQQQKEAREAEEEASLSIQEARLKITAIEENRLDQLPELSSELVKNADSVSELESVINDQRFAVNKARVEEERYRQETADTKEEISDLKQEFSEQVNAAGNLEGGIGELFTQNVGLTETLVQLKERVDETSMSMSDVFPRTRALQAALGLVGSEGNNLVDIMEKMQSGSIDVEEEFNKLSDEVKGTFGETEEEQLENFRTQMEELQNADVSDLADGIRGNTGQLRDALSRVQEAATQLGNVFNDEVVNALEAFGDGLSSITNFLDGMDEKMQNTVSRFTVLAVSLGLVVGPLLLLIGFGLLFAQALGASLIPIVGSVVGVLGAFTAVLISAREGNQEAQDAISSLENVFDRLGATVRYLNNVFDLYLKNDIAAFGEGIFDVIQSLNDEFSDNASVASVLNKVFESLGDTFARFGAFLSNNSDAIASAIATVVDIVMNLGVFMKGLFDILVEIAGNKAFQTFVVILIRSLVGLALIASEVLAVVGRLFSVFAKPIADALVILGALSAVLVSISIAAIAVFQYLFGTLTAFGLISGALSILVPSLSALASLFASLVPLGGLIIKTLSVLASGFKLLVVAAKAVIVAIAGILGVTVGTAALIVAAVIAIVAIFWYFRDEIIASVKYAFGVATQYLKNTFKMWKDIFKTLVSFVKGEISLKQAGQQIIQSFVDGILSQKKLLENTLKDISDTVFNLLGFGSAPPDLGSSHNPKNWGQNVGGSFAEGMKSTESEVGSAAQGLSPSEEDFMQNMPDPEQEMNQTGDFNPDGTRSIGGSESQAPESESKEINVNERAIFFEKGAFQGVSDEELPMKVRDVVNKSLDEIVRDLEAKGVETE